MGPIVLQSISPLIHRRRRRDRRAPDGRAPGEVLRGGRGGGRRQRHVPLSRRSTTSPRRSAPRASTSLRAGVAFNPETEPEDGRRSRADAVDIVLCMSIHPGYSGQPFREETYDRIAGCAPRCRDTCHDPGRRRGQRDEHRAALRRGRARCSSPRRRSSAARICRARTAGSCSADVSIARALELAERGAAARVSEADRRRGRRPRRRGRRRRRDGGRAAGTPRWSRSKRPASARAARRST